MIVPSASPFHVDATPSGDPRPSTTRAVLEQEPDTVEEMVNKVAHDINNAISPASLCAESLLVSDPTLSVRAREYLTTIQHSVHDVAASVAQMLEFYRSRKPQLALSRVDVNRVVESVSQTASARWAAAVPARAAALELKRDLAPALPAIIGVESEIRDALVHLVTHATDAMPQGGPLTLRTRAIHVTSATGQSAARIQVTIEVADAGAGRDENIRRRFLGTSSLRDEEIHPGSGSGSVHDSMRRHGADLEIDSQPGNGTTLRLLLDVAMKASVASTGENEQPHPRSRLRLLIVDDDIELLEALRSALLRDGYDVVAAVGGQAGIDVFLAAQTTLEPFAAVVTDWGMPDIDGRHVASAVRASAAPTPVFLLTDWGERSPPLDLSTQVQGMLSKPPTLAELRAAFASIETPQTALPQSP